MLSLPTLLVEAIFVACITGMLAPAYKLTDLSQNPSLRDL